MRFLYLASLLLCLLVPIKTLQSQPIAQTQTAKTDQIVAVGVFADRGLDEAVQRWQPTIDWLSQHIEGYQFKLIPLSLSQLQNELSQQKLQFIIINPSESIRIARRQSLSWLATLLSPLNGGTSIATGSVIWVKSDSPYQNLHQLAGQKIGTASPQAFGGYMAMQRELQRLGRDSDLLINTKVIGYPHESVVAELQEGDIAAAILPVCLVESMIRKGQISPNELRPINDMTPSGFECRVSTRLYPNWGFAMTGSADRTLAREILQSLLAIPKNSNTAQAAQSLGWTVPESQIELDNLFNDLGVHPLQQPWWQLLWSWVQTHYYLIILMLIVATFLPIQHLILTLRYRRNSRKLGLAQANLQQAQRRALVDKMGSSLAHELNQPLSAIRLYTEGELSRRQKGSSQTDIDQLLGKIRRQVIRVDEVVSRFRQLLHKQAVQKSQLDIALLLRDTVSLVELYAHTHKVEITFHPTHDEMMFFGDRAGLEQLLVNLLTNAIDASASSSKKQVWVTLTLASSRIKISIQDTGQGLERPIAELLTPFVTTKKEGVGLGLSICKEVAESHLGHLSFNNLDNGGCCVSIEFPIPNIRDDNDKH
ncbi:histidine kinase [Shewanella halifaxensis HAW-EB4]|uniref:histidine kinase n=1 Tax=Shewanella halifaxensis (strain HAW-EB4) TaxID=458817 RepID=B0TQJ0_SHEHH|nr:sensor histidine kinase [Shewanella halifaxensis]ABZ74983.1 histidine kinase [Shewanella halifaxensis HAW-EB4]